MNICLLQKYFHILIFTDKRYALILLVFGFY